MEDDHQSASKSSSKPEERSVVIFGPPGVGKSTFLTVLCNTIASKDWKSQPYPESRQTWDDYRKYPDSGIFPSQTQLGSDASAINKLQLRLTIEKTAYSLTLTDPPGELFARQADEAKIAQTKHIRTEFFKSLKEIDGVVLLLNSANPPSWHQVWASTIFEFKDAVSDADEKFEKLPIRLSIVFSQADEISWMARHRFGDASEWLAHKQNGFLDTIHGICEEDKVRCFFSSSIGWSSGRPNLRTYIQPVDEAAHPPQSVSRFLIPDPGGPNGRPVREPAHTMGRQRCSRAFTDPLAITEEMPSDKELDNCFGVIPLLGRESPKDTKRIQIAPWNILPALRWAAKF